MSCAFSRHNLCKRFYSLKKSHLLLCRLNGTGWTKIRKIARKTWRPYFENHYIVYIDCNEFVCERPPRVGGGQLSFFSRKVNFHWCTPRQNWPPLCAERGDHNSKTNYPHVSHSDHISLNTTPSLRGWAVFKQCERTKKSAKPRYKKI